MDIHYEPFDLIGEANPYPLYQRLRDEAPVYRTPREGFYCVSRWEDVQFVLKRADLFSSNEMAQVLMQGRMDALPWWKTLPFVLRYLWATKSNPWGMAAARSLVALDPPRHDEMRGFVNRGFTPRRIDDWEPRVQEVVNDCLTDIEGDAFDVVRDLAEPVPAIIIAEMLGVEPERRADFRRWTQAIITNISGSDRNPLNPAFSEAVIEMTRYLRAKIIARRQAPADDLITVLLAHTRGDGALNDHELFQFILLLLIAGNETTTNLIGSAAQKLLESPGLCDRATRDPACVPAIIEETLRLEAPIQMLFRNATEDVEVAGTVIPKGATVAPLIGSANRDERRFAEPDQFDPDREDGAHASLGHGVHFCLGAALARLEATAALRAVAPRLAHFQRPTSAPPLRESFMIRGPASLTLEPLGGARTARPDSAPSLHA